MMIATIGLLMVLASGGLLWAALPKGGERPAWFRRRWVVEALPIVILTGLAVGFALFLRGLL